MSSLASCVLFFQPTRVVCAQSAPTDQKVTFPLSAVIGGYIEFWIRATASPCQG
jgi:hypothetical protein